MARKAARSPMPLDAQKVAALLEAAQRRPELADFSWRDDPATADASPITRKASAPGPSRAAAGPAVESDPRTYDAKRRKIRERYIAIRFAGVARSLEDLDNTARVIKAARLAFEEALSDTALELLELAIEQNLRERALWLAEMEINYLLRDGAQFVACARAFRHAFPGAEEWDEIARLGRAIAPGEAAFGAREGVRRHEHYGPWPDLPNWIGASWDLTSEVAASDFHRAMTQA